MFHAKPAMIPHHLMDLGHASQARGIRVKMGTEQRPILLHTYLVYQHQELGVLFQVLENREEQK